MSDQYAAPPPFADSLSLAIDRLVPLGRAAAVVAFVAVPLTILSSTETTTAYSRDEAVAPVPEHRNPFGAALPLRPALPHEASLTTETTVSGAIESRAPMPPARRDAFAKSRAHNLRSIRAPLKRALLRPARAQEAPRSFGQTMDGIATAVARGLRKIPAGLATLFSAR